MHSSALSTRDRSGALAAAFAIQALLIIAFLNMAGRMETGETQPSFHLVDVRTPPPPPHARKLEARKVRAKPGGSASRNITTKPSLPVAAAATIVQPVKLVPKLALPTTTISPDGHAAPAAADGAGMGGRGSGNGTGAGDGSSDGGGVVEPPHLATSVLTSNDFPREVIQNWPRGATIFLRLRINARGYVSECLLDRGTNVPEIDSQMCNSAHELLRFRPAVDRSGQAVAGWFGYAQPAPR